MEFFRDTNDHLCIEWEQIENIRKRAWIQHRTGENDWAGTRRYLNVVRINDLGKPGGNPTDFPIFNNLSDEQILLTFVYAVNSATGCQTDNSELWP